MLSKLPTAGLLVLWAFGLEVIFYIMGLVGFGLSPKPKTPKARNPKP